MAVIWEKGSGKNGGREGKRKEGKRGRLGAKGVGAKGVGPWIVLLGSQAMEDTAPEQFESISSLCCGKGSGEYFAIGRPSIEGQSTSKRTSYPSRLRPWAF